MATVGNKYVDLSDLYKSTDRSGDVIEVIEMLNELSPVTEDAYVTECNQGTTHLHAIRSGLPSVTWGKLYKGIPNSKSGRSQVEDTTGFVEGLSSVDERLLKLAKNPGALRLSEGKSYLEAMVQEVNSRIFYGNSASDPEEFMGLAPRFNDLSAPNGKQIIDGGGTGSDNTSIWFVTWGESQTQLIYPEGTMAGVNRSDKGSQRVTDSDGNAFYVKEELFEWHLGLAVKDWRYVSRIANVDLSDMQANSINLYDLMRKAYYALQGRRVAGGRLAIYCNTDVLESLDALASNAGSNDNFIRLSRTEIEGREVLSYRGIPIRETDALHNGEARVV